MKSSSRGFTLIEILACIAIVAVLVGLSTPVLVEATRSARTTESVMKLRQLSMALSLYQQQWAVSENAYDNFYAIGLYGPPCNRMLDWHWAPPMGLSRSYALSPCKSERLASVYNPFEIAYAGAMYDPCSLNVWLGLRHTKYLQTYRENAVTFFDPHCNRPPIEEYNRFKTRRFLSVLLSGRLVNRVRQGSLTELENYSDLP